MTSSQLDASEKSFEDSTEVDKDDILVDLEKSKLIDRNEQSDNKENDSSVGNTCMLINETNSNKIQELSSNYSDNRKNLHECGIIIPKIQTIGMTMVKSRIDSIPFAVIQLLNGVPILVRVHAYSHDKHLLRAAKKADIAAIEKSKSSTILKCRFALVAKMIQTLDASGRSVLNTYQPKTVYPLSYLEHMLDLKVPSKQTPVQADLCVPSEKIKVTHNLPEQTLENENNSNCDMQQHQ